MRVAKVRFTQELLCQLIHFPPLTSIRGVEMSRDGRDVFLTVEHPDLKEVQEGDATPFSRPLFSRHQEIQFDGWGQ